MNNVFPLRPGEQKEGSDSGDGGGPEDPMLEQRVGRLEEKVDRIEAILTRLEPQISEVLRTGAKQADLTKLQSDFIRFEAAAATKDDLHKVQLDLAEVKGRVSNLPTWWMLIVAILSTWGMGFGIANYSINKAPVAVEKNMEKASPK